VKAAVEVAKDYASRKRHSDGLEERRKPVSVQAKKLKVLADVGPSLSHVSLCQFDLGFGFIFMLLRCFYVLFSIGVPMWLNDGPDTSLEQDEQSKKQAGNATQYYDV
jgi:hypothetical protein